MLALIRALPIIILLSGGAYAAHKFIVNQKQSQIDQLTARIEQQLALNATLRLAEEQNTQTISQLEEQIDSQNQAITVLNQKSQNLQTEINSYLSIFRKHDLTKLARAKPGMIESRINSGTEAVFEQVENDSKQIQEQNNDKKVITADNNTVN